MPPTAPFVAIPSQEQFIAELGPYIEKIVHNFSPIIHLYRLGMHVDDLVQESLIRALRARESFNPYYGSALKTWVVRNIRQMLSDFCDKSKTKKAASFASIPFDYESYPKLNTEIMDVRTWEVLTDMNQQLTPFAQHVLKLRAAGYSNRDVMARLQTGVNDVRAAVEQIRSVARRLYGDRRIAELTRTRRRAV